VVLDLLNHDPRFFAHRLRFFPEEPPLTRYSSLSWSKSFSFPFFGKSFRLHFLTAFFPPLAACLTSYEDKFLPPGLKFAPHVFPRWCPFLSDVTLSSLSLRLLPPACCFQSTFRFSPPGSGGVFLKGVLATVEPPSFSRLEVFCCFDRMKSKVKPEPCRLPRKSQAYGIFFPHKFCSVPIWLKKSQRKPW